MFEKFLDHAKRGSSTKSGKLNLGKDPDSPLNSTTMARPAVWTSQERGNVEPHGPDAGYVFKSPAAGGTLVSILLVSYFSPP